MVIIDPNTDSFSLPRNQKILLNINAIRAADLVEIGPQKAFKPPAANAFLVAQLNDSSRKTKTKPNTNNPTWDQTLSLRLHPHDKSSVLHLSIWDKQSGHKNYLGELKLDVNQIFFNKEGQFHPKTELQWYKLHSSKRHAKYVSGSLLALFELVIMQKSPWRKGKIDPLSQEMMDQKSSRVEKRPPIQISVEPPSRSTTQRDDGSVDSDAMLIVTSESNRKSVFTHWIDSLIEDPDTLSVTEEGFYSDSSTDILEGVSEVESRVNSGESRVNSGLDTDSEIEREESATESATESTTESVADSESAFEELRHSVSPKKKFSLKNRTLRRNKHKHNNHKNFELRNRKVNGVLFLEIVSCSNLPLVTSKKRLGRFDMDPFVVVTFGRNTFRTSWQRHTINPEFNERLAFEVLDDETSFDVWFLVMDKDRFSLHDDVGHVLVPLRDITKTATGNWESLSTNNNSTDEFTDNEVPENDNIKFVDEENVVTAKKRGLIHRKPPLNTSAASSKFKTMDLKLTLADSSLNKDDLNNAGLNNAGLNNTKQPRLKVRARYETYDNLRRQFWTSLLEQYCLEDNPQYDYIELISLFDTLGCQNSDSVVTKFFETHHKLAWGGDTLKIVEIVECLERHVTSTHNDVIKVFEIEKCPICLKKSLKKSNDLDIVTHFAICGSKDWSVVNKLLVSTYVSPQLASKRWFTKLLIKISYGSYQLGSNSANILVQDRTTGVILEEKMGVYVRLGIRLLYKGLDSAKRKRIRSLLHKLSVKQGIKFDNPKLKAEIASFVKFHKLDLSDCLQTDIEQYTSFNDFFYRRLKPGARPIEGDDTSIMVSPADCRCTTFATVDQATELWIKGRNFTIAKLFNGNVDNLESTNIYNSENCRAAVFRLAPQDYHRFHSPVKGRIRTIKFIDGEYYTVNPMAIRSQLDVFGENVRAIVTIDTEDFGPVVVIPVGAMMVGSIVLSKLEGQTIERGEELGYFKFGGSTLIVLVDKTRFEFDSDLLKNTLTCVETLVRMGQSIGHRPDVREYPRERVSFKELPKESRKNLIRVITGGEVDVGGDVGMDLGRELDLLDLGLDLEEKVKLHH